MKKLGRIRPGGGWRKLGQSSESKAPKGRGAGYDYLHVAIDDHSRYAFVEVHPDERGVTWLELRAASRRPPGRSRRAGRAGDDRPGEELRALQGVRRGAVRDRGSAHRDPSYRPQTNGKAERFNRTMLDEWAYARLYRSNGARLAVLPRWIETYNRRRPHTALGGLTPISRVQTT